MGSIPLILSSILNTIALNTSTSESFGIQTPISAVLAGLQPHSSQGKGAASSAIANMEHNPMAYPPVIRLSGSNELKITAKSFERALQQLEARLT